MKSRPLALLILLALAGLALLALGCGDEGPASRPDGTADRLAGGGRKADDDPFMGGADGSGPVLPDFPEPAPGYPTLFYSEIDCAAEASLRVITNAEDWQAWWSEAIACLPPWILPDCPPYDSIGWGDPPPDSLPWGDPPPPDSVPWDSLPGDSSGGGWVDTGWVYPDTLCGDTLYPYPGGAPEVDFGANVVIAIRLEEETSTGRALWVRDVVSGPEGTTVFYEVSRLGEDCEALLMRPGLSPTTSLTTAVLVPRPVTEPVAWTREDVVYHCDWAPDPNEPLALYYTDGDCDLGPGEAVIRDAEAWQAWIDSALACDMARWYEPGDSSRPSDPTIPSIWIGSDVDFATHAVLILRADPQTQWGGGVWLDRIAPAEEGTTIAYTVMAPGSECPPVDGGGVVRPTVAIRVPLPLPDPIVWERHVEMIDCHWESDGSGGVPPAR